MFSDQNSGQHSLEITYLTVEWISVLNITINFCELCFFFPFYFFKIIVQLQATSNTTRNLFLNSTYLQMSWYRMKNLVSCLIFSALQINIVESNYPTYKSNSFTQWNFVPCFIFSTWLNENSGVLNYPSFKSNSVTHYRKICWLNNKNNGNHYPDGRIGYRIFI